MRKLALTVVLLAIAIPVLAAEGAGASSDNPMAKWKPPRVTNEAQDKKEIAALWKSMQDAEKKGDVNAAADFVDYPVLMMTDNSKGEGMGAVWTREKWIQVMEPFYKHPKPDMKVTHKSSIFLMSDALASVDDLATLKMGAKTTTVRSSTMLIKKDGKWLVKAMAEGGWGDMATSAPAAAESTGGSSGMSQGMAPSSPETGAGMGTGTGTGTMGQGTGTGSSAPGAGTEKPTSTTK